MAYGVPPGGPQAAKTRCSSKLCRKAHLTLRLASRRPRSLRRRHQCDHTEGRMIVVVALVEAHAARLVEGELGTGPGAEAFRRSLHRPAERQPEVQELPVLEVDASGEPRHLEPKAPDREPGPRAPGARGPGSRS